MSYQHDSDGPDLTSGFFTARKLAAAAIFFIIGLSIYIGIRIIRSDKVRLDDAISISKLELKYSPYNYSFESSGDVLTVNLWKQDTVPVAKKAAEGDPEASADWGNLKDNVLQYANAIDSNLFVQDVKGITVIVQLVNESNHDKKLLVYKNCSLVYDVTKGG